MSSGNIADKIKQVFASSVGGIVRCCAVENDHIKLNDEFTQKLKDTGLGEIAAERVVEQLDNLDGEIDGEFNFWDVYGNPLLSPYDDVPAGYNFTSEKAKQNEIFAKLAQGIVKTFVDPKHLPSETGVGNIQFKDKPTEGQIKHQYNETKLDNEFKKIAQNLKPDNFGKLVLKAANIEISNSKDLKLTVETSYKKYEVFFLNIKGLSDEQVTRLASFLGPEARDTGRWKEYEHSLEINMHVFTPDLLKALKQASKP